MGNRVKALSDADIASDANLGNIRVRDSCFHFGVEVSLNVTRHKGQRHCNS